MEEEAILLVPSASEGGEGGEVGGDKRLPWQGVELGTFAPIPLGIQDVDECCEGGGIAEANRSAEIASGQPGCFGQDAAIGPDIELN